MGGPLSAAAGLMSDPDRRRRRRSVRRNALLLGLLAVGIYVAFILGQM